MGDPPEVDAGVGVSAHKLLALVLPGQRLQGLHERARAGESHCLHGPFTIMM